MTFLRFGIVVFVSLIPIGALALFARRMHSRAGQTRVLGSLTLAGALAALVVTVMERALMKSTGFTIEAAPGATASAVMLAFVVMAPLEEAAKALVVWPTFRTGRLTGRWTGLAFSAAAAAGFASIDTGQYLFYGEISLLSVLRALLGLPAQLFCALLWGYALGEKARREAGWFRWAWLTAVVGHGLYDHIVFGRGPGMLALVVPMLAAMGVLTWAALRDVAPEAMSPRSKLLQSIPPPSLSTMQRVLSRRDQPLMIHWIAFGALVNVGVILAALALAVYLGHRMGVDFAAADEADMRSNGPIVLLGIAVVLAFPAAGYLVARASGTTSVLEPAMATAVALFVLVTLLSMTAPVAVLFALAVAPVAFGLACGGAWLGLSR